MHTKSNTNKLLYHITHIDNIPSILERKGLFAFSKITDTEETYQDIANQDIQHKISATEIPIEPKGSLHDYVPFYFAPRSPMLFTLSRNGIDQRDIVYLITDTDTILSYDLQFVFTNGHAIMKLTDFYSDIEEIDEVDWTIMSEKMWMDTLEDPDRKRRRQAEFLVYQTVPITLLSGIAVYDQTRKHKIEEVLKNNQSQIGVGVRRNFYF